MRQPVPFGKYLLLDRISVGGMAEVFKAKSYGVEGFEKIIAIKRILPTMGEDRDFIKMFIDEAKIAGQLAHANICQIFELGRIDGSHFIAMEYIWGKDLLQIQNRLRKIKQQMPVAMACFSIAKVLEGLDYAHPMNCPRYEDCKGSATVRRLARIGANSTILPGVEIGEGSLIGAGSVVVHDVPAGTIITGDPARVIKQVAELTCWPGWFERPYVWPPYQEPAPFDPGEACEEVVERLHVPERYRPPEPGRPPDPD